MCLLLLQYRTVAAAPVLVAANREEYFGRKATVPCIQAGSPRVLCGSDQQAGGTWLGVNQHGLVVGVTNRLKSNLPDHPRSRGLLCRDLLDCTSAAEATAQAIAELETGNYAGANYACFDAKTAAVVHGGDSLKVVELDAGVHILTNGDVDDRSDPRQFFARKFLAARFPNSIESFVDLAVVLCRQRPNDEGEPTIIFARPGSWDRVVNGVGRGAATRTRSLSALGRCARLASVRGLLELVLRGAECGSCTGGRPQACRRCQVGSWQRNYATRRLRRDFDSGSTHS